jgi:hypothetical protein
MWCAQLCINKPPTFFSKVLSIFRSDFSSINWTCSQSVKDMGWTRGLQAYLNSGISTRSCPSCLSELLSEPETDQLHFSSAQCFLM